MQMVAGGTIQKMERNGGNMIFIKFFSVLLVFWIECHFLDYLTHTYGYHSLGGFLLYLKEIFKDFVEQLLDKTDEIDERK